MVPYASCFGKQSGASTTLRLFAISDLHLSFGVDKPMDIFGDHWADHAGKMQAAWDTIVGPDDWVLVGGDTSWGLTWKEAAPDLEWLGARTGRKVLIRGNHCTWWPRGTGVRDKLQKLVHPSIHMLQANSFRLDDGTVVVGSRLWDPPDAPWAEPEAAKIFQRELGFLQQSIEAGKALGGCVPGSRTVALIHYPPKYADGRETPAVQMMRDANVRLCVYGHLHGRDLKHGYQGDSNGVRYVLASVDAIDFRPIPVELADPL
jgi:predicted phosphohydrolase